MMIDSQEIKIAVIGLGYVGLPLAVEFSKIFPVTGFDINAPRIKALCEGVDVTLEVGQDELSGLENLSFTNQSSQIASCNVFLITVPTPIDEFKRPDLTPLLSASEQVGAILKRGDVVVYESTVYPGATEEDCVPVLEKFSSLKYNEDFFVGYSPERINPGDKEHRLTSITKITSGSTIEAADFIDQLYSKVIIAGTHRAGSIKVAEAAKVIENAQRDINIAFMNELAIIFNTLGISTREVLDAAETKWNFMSFQPGLVGGHCIGIDPYYLAHKAEQLGYKPEVILSGRRLNDSMTDYITSQLIKTMIKKNMRVNGARVLLMGLSFKENCPDTRNSKSFDLIKSLKEYGCDLDVFDPWIDDKIAERYSDFEITKKPLNDTYDAIVIAVPHNQFKTLGIKNIRLWGREDCVLYDVKNMFKSDLTDLRL